MKRSDSLLEIANDVVRFALEVSALVALGYWGSRVTDRVFVRWALAAGMPLFAGLIWGAFVAPKAAARLEDPARLVVEMAIFSAAFAGLALAHQRELALIFAGLVTLNLAGVVLLNQR